MRAAEADWLLEATGGRVVEFFAELGIVLPDRPGLTEASVSCFADPSAHRRDDRRPSCSVNLLSGLWNCMACGAHGNAYAAAVILGYSDRSAAELARRYGLFMALERSEQAVKPKLPNERMLATWWNVLRRSPRMLARLAELRAWTSQAIIRLGLGWDGERIVFPVRNEKLKVVGAVRYLPGGEPKSLAFPGSKRELFPAPEMIGRKHPLFVVEGEPDAVAVWSAGQRAVAVPGAGSWRKEWAARLSGRRVVVLCDCDPQGRALAARVAEAVPSARVVDIAPGRSDGYDVGDLLREAAESGGVWQLGCLLGDLVA